ncbi:MAG: DHH family phosphoesterase [Candidatus Omnitrophica bacterium]|nr:DHH family phosphoesterase [Candidatus Omnitrophota bacterium]
MDNIPKFLREILYKKNIKNQREIQKFLYPTLNDLSQPNIIETIELASEEIIKSIEKKEKIFIYGDGDIDGIAGVFFILKFLQDKNVEFNYYLTSRFEDYEIEEELVDYFLKERYKLIILVDIGVSSYKFLKRCAENNLKVIVIDHHQTEIEYLPEKHIYIHPILSSKGIDFSATGLSLKLFQDLVSNYYPFSLSDYICIAGLATLNENVKLTDDNRIFVKEMMKNLKNSKIKGLNFLVSKYLNDREIKVEDIKIKINPKLNSPGRFGKPIVSLHLLLEEEEKEIENLLKEIEQLDRKRYQIIKKVTKSIENKYGFENRFIIFDDLPESLCGIISSRLVERFNLPFLVMSKKKDIIKGSGRAPDNFNLYENMKKIKDKFLSFGGHKNAIGFKFNVKDKEEIENYWKNLKIENLSKNQEYFDTILDIEDIKPEIFEYLNLLKPYGKGNNPPVFLSKNVLIKKIKKGNEDIYWAKKGNSIFECKVEKNKLKEEIRDIFYTPEIKKIDGYYKIILVIRGPSLEEF